MSRTASSVFRITCYGRSELPEDNPIYGTYWLDSYIHLGGADQLTDAMLMAEHYALKRKSSTAEDELCFFLPCRVRIYDRRNWLAMGGQFNDDRIEWSTPVASEREAIAIHSKVTHLRKEASYERCMADNYATAKSLDAEADVLELRLVDRMWHATATLAIQNADYRARFRQMGLPHEVCRIPTAIDEAGLPHCVMIS